MTLGELTVVVREGSRTFFQSDKRGGFLVGAVGPSKAVHFEWSVNGKAVVSEIGISVNGKGLDAASLDSALVSPDRVVQVYKDGTRVELSPLEGLEADANGVALSVTRPAPADISLRAVAAQGYLSLRGKKQFIKWQEKGEGHTLVAYAGPGSTASKAGLTVEGATSLKAILITLKHDSGPELLERAYRGSDASVERRAQRMERLINRGYLRLSDRLMTTAIAWTKLSLDALLVERERTFAVSSLPWNGSFDGRANLQSLSGLALTSGEYENAAKLLRTWAETQDIGPSRKTYGRIARLLQASPPVYDGVDVGGLFVRGLYDYIVATNDTALAEELYPSVRRCIDGMIRYNVGDDNLVRHGAAETWMNPDRFRKGTPPFSAVEVQTLWQFEQEIGTFIAQLAGDSVAVKTWSQGAAQTSSRFTESFVDTGRRIVYDYLDGNGRGIDVLRPNGLLAIDGIDGELIQQALVRRSVGSLLYSRGGGTLAREETGFQPAANGVLPTNGAIATWLVGPFVYAVTRSDRPDLGYVVSRALAQTAMEREMIGTLPSFFPAAEDRLPESGVVIQNASLLGMAEFVRSVYQDYLGIRVDVPSSVLRFEPKLPPAIESAEFTVYMGPSPILGSYRREQDHARFTLSLPDLPRPVLWRFTWMLDRGDAWIGSVKVRPGSTVSIVAAPEGILAYEGEKELKLDEQWFVKGFSKKNDLPPLRLAEFPREVTEPLVAK
jgi:glycogen debranching enzyme